MDFLSQYSHYLKPFRDYPPGYSDLAQVFFCLIWQTFTGALEATAELGVLPSNLRDGKFESRC